LAIFAVQGACDRNRYPAIVSDNPMIFEAGRNSPVLSIDIDLMSNGGNMLEMRSPQRYFGSLVAFFAIYCTDASTY